MEVILDSSFIISCVKRKIDFLEELEQLGFRIIVPKEVLQEMKDLKLRSPHAEKSAIEVALDIFSRRKIEKMSLSEGKSVDEGLISLGKKGAFIATLDGGIRRVVPNLVVINNAGNKVSLERK